MADDEDNNSSGKVAGGLAGAAVGVALISNPANVLTMLGVSYAAPAATGGMMTVAAAAAAPAAAISGGAILALAIVAAACIGAGILAGSMVMKAVHSFSKPETKPQPAYDSPSPRLPQEQVIGSGKSWTQTVETERAATPAAKGIGGV